MSREYVRLRRLRQAKLLYFRNPDGLSDEHLATLLDVSRATAYKYRILLHAFEAVIGSGRYTCVPDQDDIEFAEAIMARYKNRIRTYEPEGV